MAYSKTTWENLPSTNTPLYDVNLNKIENELKFLDDNSKFLACTNLGTKNNTFDLNDLQPGETCSWDIGSAPINAPTTGGRVYCFWGHGSGGKIQIAFHYNVPNVYVRTYFSNSWSRWLNNGTDKVAYSIPSTTGWIRIAELHTMAFGNLTITTTGEGGNTPVMNINVGCVGGYVSSVTQTMHLTANNSMFTKARICRKGAYTSYLEIYKALEGSKTLQIASASNSIEVYLYQSYQAGSIPDGYSAPEYSLPITS